MASEETLSSAWDQHLASEFAAKSPEQALATMAAEPYVNVVPLMIGARGRDEVRDELLAGVLAELYDLGCHCFSLPPLTLDHAEDVLLAHDQVLFTVDIDLRAGVFAEENAIIDFDVQRHDLSVFVQLAFADRDDLALLGFFLGGVRNDDAPLGLLFLFDSFHDHTILQRSDLHLPSSFQKGLA
jgi:hypothetical protein